jgi:hypothetical protein
MCSPMRRIADLLFMRGDEDDVTTRHTASRAVLAVAGVAFFLSAASAFVMPTLWGADERVHLAYVESVLRGDLPTVDTPVPLDGHFPVLREYYPAGTHGDIWVANHPPLTYVLAAPALWVASALGVDRAPPMLLRLLSAAGMAVGVVATAAVADALLPRRRRLAVLAAALAAVTPIAVSIGSYGYNDGVAVAVGAALLATTCRVARWGGTTPRLVGGAVLASMAVLTRSSLLPLVAIAAAVWVGRGLMTRHVRPVLGGVVIGLAAAVAGGWFYLRNIDLYGDPTGASHLQDKFGRERQGTVSSLLRPPWFVIGAWQDLWASFRDGASIGTGKITMGTARPDIGTRMVLGALVAGAAIVGWIVAFTRPRPVTAPGVLAWSAALLWMGATVVGMASFVSGGGTPFPRYLLACHAATVVVLVGGLVRLPGGDRLAIALVVLLGALDVHLIGLIEGLAARTTLREALRISSSGELLHVLALAAAFGCALVASGAYRRVATSTAELIGPAQEVVALDVGDVHLDAQGGGELSVGCRGACGLPSPIVPVAENPPSRVRQP